MRIVLVQPDDEAACALTPQLGELEHAVCRAGGDGGGAAAFAQESRPQVVLVLLDAAPDAALDLLGLLDAMRAFRGVPILFAGGAAPSLSRAQESYPRASFTRMEQLHTALASLRAH